VTASQRTVASRLIADRCKQARYQFSGEPVSRLAAGLPWMLTLTGALRRKRRRGKTMIRFIPLEGEAERSSRRRRLLATFVVLILGIGVWWAMSRWQTVSPTPVDRRVSAVPAPHR